MTQLTTVPHQIGMVGDETFRGCFDLRVAVPDTDFNSGACAFIDCELHFLPARQ
jgi:hypothetical protein